MSIDIYTRIQAYKETFNKSIYLVRNEVDHLFYIERRLNKKNKHIYQIIQSINHPYIPKINEIIETEEELIVIEEFINASTLDRYIINDELYDKDRLTIIEQLLDAVSILHKNHIIHRDIKPENIFYDGKNIKLFDFDIARIPTENQKKDTTILGSVGYAAPEQFGFMQSDERTDIYAIGVLINVLYTSFLPSECLFEGEYKKVIEKATRIDPDKRYKNIRDMKQALHFSLSDNWTIPGFRKNNLMHKVIAILGYAFMIHWAFTGEYEDIVPGTLEDIVNRLNFFVSLIMVTFYCSNYMNVHRFALFRKSPYKLLRFLGHIITLFGFLTFWLLIVGIVLTLLS